MTYCLFETCEGVTIKLNFVQNVMQAITCYRWLNSKDTKRKEFSLDAKQPGVADVH